MRDSCGSIIYSNFSVFYKISCYLEPLGLVLLEPLHASAKLTVAGQCHSAGNLRQVSICTWAEGQHKRDES